jgi:hypothetical protein
MRYDKIPDVPFKWSDLADPIPEIGSRVKILIWSREGVKGTVEGYEFDKEETAGYLMVWVRPEKRPEWHRREYPERDIALFAGIELESSHVNRG